MSVQCKRVWVLFANGIVSGCRIFAYMKAHQFRWHHAQRLISSDDTMHKGSSVQMTPCTKAHQFRWPHAQRLISSDDAMHKGSSVQMMPCTKAHEFRWRHAQRPVSSDDTMHEGSSVQNVHAQRLIRWDLAQTGRMWKSAVRQGAGCWHVIPGCWHVMPGCVCVSGEAWQVPRGGNGRHAPWPGVPLHWSPDAADGPHLSAHGRTHLGRAAEGELFRQLCGGCWWSAVWWVLVVSCVVGVGGQLCGGCWWSAVWWVLVVTCVSVCGCQWSAVGWVLVVSCVGVSGQLCGGCQWSAVWVSVVSCGVGVDSWWSVKYVASSVPWLSWCMYPCVCVVSHLYYERETQTDGESENRQTDRRTDRTTDRQLEEGVSPGRQPLWTSPCQPTMEEGLRRGVCAAQTHRGLSCCGGKRAALADFAVMHLVKLALV